MIETTRRDRTYHLVLEAFVERGHAPHYTEIARHFGVAPDGRPGGFGQCGFEALAVSWLFPGEDGRYLSSAPRYAPVFFERLREVTHGSPFWDQKGG